MVHSIFKCIDFTDPQKLVPIFFFEVIFFWKYESIIRHVTVQTVLDINATKKNDEENVSCDTTIGKYLLSK